MKRLTCILVALLAVTGVARADARPTSQPDAARPNPGLADIAPNTWRKIAPPPPAPKGIMAYSGGVFDSKNNVFLIFGGGHADYWGNEVCALEMATLTWKRMYAPDAESRYTNANIDNSQGKLRDSDKPYTRHSYQMQVFVPSAGGMFIWSGCGPGWGSIKPTCPTPRDAWMYDYAANKWKLLATDGPDCYDGGTAFDAKRGVVWAWPGQSWPPLWQFDLKTGKWSKHDVRPEIAGGLGTRMDWSPKRDRLILTARDGKTVGLIDPATFKFEKSDTSAYTPAGGGMTYLPRQDVAVHLGGSKVAPMGVLDLAANRWLPLKPGGELPSTDGYGVYGRLRYSDIDNIVIFVGPGGTWAWRPPAEFDLPAPAPTSQPE
ncbi:MAG: hypothetical protein BIFFINMI_01309 [Phycisphaerae bacterium]|nr:hypothetical protein [Phycisphaerae bacterium]